MKFQELNLHPEVLAGIEKAGFADCTDVQSKVCPISIQGRDVMARSKTGSGKTAVFVITILEKIARERAEGRHPKAMIVSPTRELALQIASDAEILSSGMSDVRVECFYGGVGYDKQKKALFEGVDIYVGTPGRLLDFMNSNGILFSTISMFVVDEADRMFDMGFYPDIQRMFAALPDKTKRQTMMFSATLSTKVRNLAWNYMNNPEEIELEPEEITVNAIVQELYHTTRHDKFKLLLHLLKKENPSSVLIFANTKYMTVDVSERLKLNGYNVACLMGDMPQEKRQKALERMRDNKIWGLVATDVAARGLQIDDLPLVINYDIPEDFESYVHRIGRTARAGKNGKAITLADEEYVWGLEAIENYIQMKIPVMWADSTDDVEDLSAGKKIYNKEHLAGVTSTYSHGKRPARPNGRGPVRSPKRANVSKVADKRRSSYVRKDAIDDAKLSRMSQDERLAYYRKEFFAEEKRDDDIRKPQPANKAPASKKPRPQSRPCSAASSQRDKVQVGNSKPAKVQPKPAQKGLKGLFNKLFGRK